MRNIFSKFFEQKNVLITGHTGFIGSWLSIALIEMGANVIGYALPPNTKKDNFVVTNLRSKLKHNVGDVRNLRATYKVFKNYQPEIIFHLAAQPIVRKSYSMPKETYDINVGGTVNVFEAFRKTKSSKVMINFTSDKCYENKEVQDKYKENDRLGGQDPYSSSKACSELITSAYWNSFIKNQNKKIVSTVRSGNVIGGGDWQEDRLIPDCMRALENDQEIQIRNPEYVRPWQYVLEPIRGILILSMKMWELDNNYSGSWNLGPNENSIFSVKEIVEKVIKSLGKGSFRTLSRKDSDDLYESKILLLDSSKAKEFLGWNPILSIDETIQLLCNWYMEKDVDYEYDAMQIRNYFKKINEEIG